MRRNLRRSKVKRLISGILFCIIGFCGYVALIYVLSPFNIGEPLVYLVIIAFLLLALAFGYGLYNIYVGLEGLV